jgi:Kef-type K+ transport system membrane component KefB
MSELLPAIIAETTRQLNPILLFGLIVLGGTLAAMLVQKIGVPQVVGCVIIGVILGNVPGMITQQTIHSLHPFTMFTLGIIGFMIGSELRAETLKAYGKQFFIILLSQGIGTFILVAVGTTTVAWMVTKEPLTSIAMGLLFGAIASATAPASTANVLWEYKTRGPLTTAIHTIVALNDAMALLLYRVCATAAQAVTNTELQGGTLVLLVELLAGVVLGFVTAVALYWLLKLAKSEERTLQCALACLMVVVGISMMRGLDPILPAMTLGITMTNLSPVRSKGTFELVKKFSRPIYIAFFVVAGAHIKFASLSWPIAALTATYIFFRVLGKVSGSWFGATISDASAVVRKYLGICLLPQAGIAIGLAILAGQQFQGHLKQCGEFIVMVVMTEAFIVEILGPVLVKFSMKKAGEVGLNITEEDLIETYLVGDVMDTKPTSIPDDMALGDILEIFSATDAICYPVVDKEFKVVGKITIEGIKQMLANQDVVGWLLACDIAEPVLDKVTPEMPLGKAFEVLRKNDYQELLITAAADDDRLLGVLDHRATHRKLTAEILRRRRTADGASEPAIG